MLLSLPIALICVGSQPCPVPGVGSHRTPSPTFAAQGAASSLRLALERTPLPSASRIPRASMQPPLRMVAPTPSKAMYMCALATVGAVAGMYGGWELGGPRGSWIGVSVGGVLGGLLGWKLVP